MKINIFEHADSFAENKDVAKDLRETYLKPTYLNTNDEIIINFAGVDSTTQSFIHALISELLQLYGENVLERVIFENCNSAVKTLVSTVINYSLE